VILDKKIESRERYMKNLPGLCKQVEKLSVSVTRHYLASPIFPTEHPRSAGALQRTMGCPAKDLPPFLSQAAVTEELGHLADEAHHTSLYLQSELAKSSQQKTSIAASEESRRAGNESLVFPLRLCRGISDAEGWLRQAFKAKTEMVEANLPWLFPSQRKHKSRLSFLDLIQKGTWADEGGGKV